MLLKNPRFFGDTTATYTTTINNSLAVLQNQLNQANAYLASVEATKATNPNYDFAKTNALRTIADLNAQIASAQAALQVQAQQAVAAGQTVNQTALYNQPVALTQNSAYSYSATLPNGQIVQGVSNPVSPPANTTPVAAYVTDYSPAAQAVNNGGTVETSTGASTGTPTPSPLTDAPVDTGTQTAQDSVKSFPWGLAITVGLALFS